ncbi:MAG: hypothetical protein ABI599_13680 [Flavobacteriales bacterium]
MVGQDHRPEEGNALQELARIRGIMDRSQRFLSLSGLSGVAAGVVALATACAAHWWLGNLGADRDNQYAPLLDPLDPGHLLWGRATTLILLGTTAAVLAVAGAWWFTRRNALRQGHALWDAASKRLFIHMTIPLFAGGAFCIALLALGLPALVAPATLVFYGLALINASKFTLDEVLWLGMSQLVLGLFAMFFPGHGLLCWALGFGVLHLGYGTFMYLRHERR